VTWLSSGDSSRSPPDSHALKNSTPVLVHLITAQASRLTFENCTEGFLNPLTIVIMWNLMWSTALHSAGKRRRKSLSNGCVTQVRVWQQFGRLPVSGMMRRGSLHAIEEEMAVVLVGRAGNLSFINGRHTGLLWIYSCRYVVRDYKSSL